MRRTAAPNIIVVLSSQRPRLCKKQELTFDVSRLPSTNTVHMLILLVSGIRSDKKDSEATAARLKGNRFYRAKRWEKALELYMTSLRARPYTVNTLANVAQVKRDCVSRM